MKKCLSFIMSILMVASMLIGVIPLSASADDEPIYYGHGGWQGNKFVTSSGEAISAPNHYFTINNPNRDSAIENNGINVMYCIQRGVGFSDGEYTRVNLGSLNGNGNPAITGFNSRVINGLKVILQNGYPLKTLPVSTLDIKSQREATAILVWMWLCINDVPHQSMTGVFSLHTIYSYPDDVQARIDYLSNMTKEELQDKIKSYIRHSEAGNLTAGWDYLTNGLYAALHYSPSNPSISAPDVTLKWNAANNRFEGTTTVSNNTNGAFTYTTPSGFTITQDGNELSIFAPSSLAGATNVQVMLSATDTTGMGAIYGYFPTDTSAESQTTIGVSSEPTTVKGSFKINVEDFPVGDIEIIKKSSLGSQIDGNNCYSVEGAEFSLVKKDDSSKSYTLVTDKNGYAKLTNIDAGTYTLTETKPPKGHKISNEPKDVVIGGDIVHVDWEDEAKNDPAGIKIQKIDAKTKQPVPSGEGSLAGAVYEVRYFDSTTINANWNMTGYERHWFLKTDDDGYANFSSNYLDPDSNSDALYVDEYNKPCLPLGTILVKEVQAPEGYNLDTTEYGPYHIIDENSLINVLSDHTIISEEEVIEGKFSILKLKEVDNGEPAPEAGIRFIVKDSSGNKVDELITDDDGKATSTDLPYGTYTVSQQNTEFGLSKVADFTVTIPGDNGKTYELVNKLYRANLKLIKIDGSTEKPIAGVTFILRNALNKYYFVDSDNKVVWIDNKDNATGLVTDANGIILVENLKYGRYYFIETATVKPYAIDTTEHSVLLDSPGFTEENTVVITVNNDIELGQIKLYKKGEVLDRTEEETKFGLPVLAPKYEEHFLAGAVFQVIAAEDIYVNGEKVVSKDEIVDTLTTNSDDAVLSKELYLGNYILHEAVVPEGYVRAEDTLIHLNWEGVKDIVIETANVHDQKQTTRFKLEKLAEEIVVDQETGDVVTEINSKEGFVFGLYVNETIKYQNGDVAYNKGDRIAAAKSDSNGNVVFTAMLPAANYYVQEEYAPDDRYILDETQYPVSNKEADDTMPVISFNVTDKPIVNELDKALAQIVKVDSETGEILKIAGFKFEIFDKDGNKVDVVETNEEGIAKLRMPLRHDWTYTVKETAVPEGFLLNKKSFELKIVDETIEKIGDNEERYTCRFSNTRVKGSISIEKTGLMITGSEVVEENGFEVTRVIRTVEKLSGAKFRITAREDIVYNGEVKFHAGDEVAVLTTVNGETKLDDMYLGKYKIEEIEAPAGYVLKPNITNIDLLYAGDNVAVVAKEYTFHNDLRDMTVNMTKHAEVLGTITDSDGNVDVVYSYEAGEGFTFGLFNTNDIINVNTNEIVVPADTLIEVCVSDAEGKITFGGKYPVGQFYVKEIATLPKYELREDFRYDIDNSCEDATVETLDFNLEEPIKNDFIYDIVKVTKTDITGGEGLPGATLEIRDEDNNVIYRNVTGEDGALDEIKLIPGDYFLIELFSPNGYALSEEVVQFTVTEEGNVEGETTMKDDVTRFSFYKIDEDGNSLAGAEFTLYVEGEDGELEVYAVTESDEDGIVTFENLLVGKYIIKETKALPDYQLSSESIELEVTNEWLNSNSYTDGGELMFSIMNYPTIKTGRELSTGSIVAIVVGSIALIGLAGVGVILLKKKKPEQI